MSEFKIVSNGANYAVASMGVPGEWEGKAFFKETLNTTSSEISMGSIASGEEGPFFHYHKDNEEVYVFLTGQGKMQIDDDVFPVSAGTVVRVSPAGVRNIKNCGNETMRYLCIQAKSNSLENYVLTDAVVPEYKSKW